MDRIEAMRLGIELMDRVKAAYLSTVDSGGFPNTRAMLNLRNTALYPGLKTLFRKHSKDLAVYFSTNTSSIKVKQALDNDRASVYYCDPEDWRGLLLIGQLEQVKSPAEKKAIWQKGWEMYYKKGSDDPDYAIFKLVPRSVRYYHQLDYTVFEMEGNNED